MISKCGFNLVSMVTGGGKAIHMYLSLVVYLLGGNLVQGWLIFNHVAYFPIAEL